jgi:hypothetical protein
LPRAGRLIASKNVSFAIDNAILQWEEGYRTIDAARSRGPEFRALGRAVVLVQDELRKRLGSSFTVAELASLYRASTDWALDLAMRVSVDEKPPIDSSAVVDAAFYLYMREASDFAGGTRTRGSANS